MAKKQLAVALLSLWLKTAGGKDKRGSAGGARGEKPQPLDPSCTEHSLLAISKIGWQRQDGSLNA